MLFRLRANIVRELPYHMRPDWVDIEKADLPHLYIVPCSEWYLDTGCTFRLADVPANLKAGRHPVDHLAKVDAIAPSLADYEAATTSEVLILNAADRAGPYTIIEGTHRAAALYGDHLRAPNLPWRAILVADPEIAHSPWHIESPQAKRTLNLCAWAALTSLTITAFELMRCADLRVQWLWWQELRTSPGSVELPGAVCADGEDVLGCCRGADRVLLPPRVAAD